MNDRKARRERLKNRTRRGARNRGKTGLGKRTVLDFSRANPASLKEGRPIMFKMAVRKGETRVIDLLPFVITQEWYKDLREKSGEKIGLQVGDWDYKLEYPTHNTKSGPMLCLNLAFGRDCPKCNALYAEWEKDKKDQDSDKIEAMKISWRCSYNVYDYDGESGEVELWDNQAYVLFEELLQEEVDCDDEGLAIFWDLEQGKSIKYDTREKSFGGNPYHEAKSVNFVNRDPYEESILEKTHPLDAMLIIPTEEEVRRAYQEMDEEAVESEKPETKEPSSRQRPDARRRPDGKRQESASEECPHGLEFGIDCNNADVCQECDEAVFEACGRAFSVKRSTEKSDSAKPPASTRRRRRK